jgi:acyl dehydratase
MNRDETGVRAAGRLWGIRLPFKQFIGHRSEAVTNVVEKGAVRKFADAIGDSSPLYRDEEAAKASRYGRLLAPPTFPRTFEYGEIEGIGSPGQGLLHGEHQVRYERPLFVGEEVLCYAEVKDYYEKEGHEGKLGFLISERVGESPQGERIFTVLDTAILTPALRESLKL